MPDLVFGDAERPRAAALAPDACRDQCRGGAGTIDHRADRSPPGRAVAWARIVAQPLPYPSELQGDRASAACGTAEAAAPAAAARDDPEGKRHRHRRSAVLPAGLRQDVSA